LTVYVEGLTKTDYVPNIIILFAGQYFSIREPDSGLSIDPRYNGLIQRIAINPTSIDPQRPTTTTNSSSFTLVDVAHEVSKLFLNQRGFRTGSDVKIWLGRSFENMDFSDYLEMPETLLNKFQKVDNAYNFSTIERKDRINNGSFNRKNKLAVDILSGTTVITLQTIPSDFPSSGFVKINDEYVSYAGITDNNLTGCARGEFGSVPSAHDGGSDVFLIYEISATNGVDLIAQFLISSGGGGPYDVLPEGLGFTESMIDIAQFEEVRDEFFTGRNLSFLVGAIENFQSFFETEVLGPLGLRLRTNNNGKIGLAVINRNIFEIDAPFIDNTNASKSPSFSVSDDKISNRVRIFYNWNDALNIYSESIETIDSESITEFGEKPFFEISFKGVKDSNFAQSIANLYLARFSYPRPEITVDALNSSSYLLVGDKTELFSDRIPTENGDLNFASTLEVLKKSYNPVTGTVNFQLAFTSFSGLRQCFISPSDSVVSFTSQKSVTIAAGRGAHYRAGWRMRLFDTNNSMYASSQVNEIESVVGDVINFVDNWSTTLVAFGFRIMFGDYDEVSEQQKKFCFISEGSNNFNDGKVPYQITFS